MRKPQKTILALSIATLLAGCALDQNQRTGVGALGGAILGGVVGHQINHKSGAVAGAVLGALVGGAIGRYMDGQQQDLERALASSGITVMRVDQATIKLNLPNRITFPVDRDQLSPNVYGSLNTIASIMNKYEKTAIHVLGFADSTGAEQYNRDLSQRRALSAANYLASRGVFSGRMVVRGYGESYPVASNATAAGRAQNRRVEIYIRAIEKGNEYHAYAPIYR